jgi:DNA-binding CsgD family transcriptional regulator|nr:LuxR C-terminal-related transcriptional regulator [Kofleriaceae bacterium]
MKCEIDVVLDVLDAAYALEEPVEPWLATLAAQLDRALGDGSGTLAMIADLSAGELARFEHFATIGDDELWRQQIALFRQMPASMLRTFGTGPVFYFSQTAASLIGHDARTAALLEESARDLYGTSQLDAIERARAGHDQMLIERLVFTALGPFGRGVSAVIPQRAVASRPPRRAELAIWGRVASHVATAHRLREGTHAVEAVLTPGGKLVDATGPARAELARDALRAAAIAQDRIRSRRGRRTSAADATEDWKAVIGGRWSLVDQFERDGRRYLVAKVNEPHATALRELAPREAQVVELAARGYANKLIAYELGISAATVVRVLAAAAAKLGTTTRVELIQAVLDRRP